MKTTPNLELPLTPTGMVETQQAFDKAMKIIDEVVGDPTAYIKVPAPAPEDIGKILTVADDGDGNPVLAWVDPEAE